jgi:hypothetical protein
MRVRFQADADLDARILRGLRRIAPEIDFRTAVDAALTGLKDPEVLRIAADSGRILVSQDRRSLPAHFAHFSEAIDELVLIWNVSEAEEWIGRLIWIPL